MKKTSNASGLNFAHARTPEQKAQMERIRKEGICPFCPEHLKANHRAPIEWKGRHWAITKNDYPYAGTALHYLAISTSHMTKIAQISDEAFAELGRHMKRISKRNRLPGGVLVMRFGDTKRTGATIEHVHAHLIAGGPLSPKAEKIKVTVGYKKK